MTEEMITEDQYPDNESLVGHVISELDSFSVFWNLQAHLGPPGRSHGF